MTNHEQNSESTDDRDKAKEGDGGRGEEPQSRDFGSLLPDEIEAGNLESEEVQTLLLAQLQGHAGPLPSPEMLAEYKDVSPRALDWIFEAATKEQDNRHWCDKEPLRQSGRAQIFAFTIAILVILVGAFLVYEGKSTQGLAAIMVPLASILGVFVYKEIRSARSEAKTRVQEKQQT